MRCRCLQRNSGFGAPPFSSRGRACNRRCLPPATDKAIVGSGRSGGRPVLVEAGEVRVSLQPLLDASLVIQAHAFAAMAAFILGVIQLLAPKGTLPHRTIGLVWIALMLIVAGTSAFIYRPTQPGDPFWARFSLIHLFTIITAYGLIHGGYLLARGGPALKYHARPFISVFIGGLVIAGVLAFLPGRIMHEVVFGAR